MIQPSKYFEPNWSDGMKISEKHLYAQDNFMLDALRDGSSLRLNGFNYGLLPVAGSDTQNALFDVLNTVSGDVQLSIKHCSAVTPAGYRIELKDYRTNVKSLQKTAEAGKETVGDFYILIAVNPFEKIPFGDIDPEEIPPRHSFVSPKYYVELMPASSLSDRQTGGNYLVIGKVSLRENGAEADPDFIPACAGVSSYYPLIRYYDAFFKSIGSLQQHAFKILQKTANVNQNTALASNVKTLCRIVLDRVADVYFFFRNMVRELPPVYMTETLSRIAQHLNNSLLSLPSAEMEEMLGYSFEWSNVAPRALLKGLSTVAEINYTHNNCGEALIAIRELLQSLEATLGKLSELDYIGQRRENIIVNEQNITPAAKIQKGWSVLD